MPELNFENIKTKRRVTEKVRPWDNQVAVPKKSSVTKSKPNVAQKKNDVTRKKTSEEMILSTVEDKPLLNIESLIEPKSLAVSLSAKENEKYISYEKEECDGAVVRIGEHSLDGKMIYDLFSKISTLSSPAKLLYEYFLKSTEYGKFKNVKIGRREIEAELPGISKTFKDSLIELQREKMIIVNKGYVKPTKRLATFYTIG